MARILQNIGFYSYTYQNWLTMREITTMSHSCVDAHRGL